MDIQPTNQQPMSDDQELAKVLAGITAGADSSTSSDLASDLDKEADTTTSDASSDVSTPAPLADTTTQSSPSAPDPIVPDPIIPVPTPTPTLQPMSFSTPAPAPVVDSGLEAIKHDALNELRPLVDKLNLSGEEKFDTYLLLIRSTDDTTLIGPAFEAARTIVDETEKAQALLDIVKEIDYLSNPQKQN